MRVSYCVRRPEVDISGVALRDFRMEDGDRLYISQYRQARRCADALREQGLEPLEADINPAERYLMERFVAGSAVLHGRAAVGAAVTCYWKIRR